MALNTFSELDIREEVSAALYSLVAHEQYDLDLIIELDSDLEVEGYTIFEDTQALIVLREYNTKVLAHELVHIAQFIDKKLKNTKTKGYFNWLGKDVKITGTRSDPWEGEAYSLEVAIQWVIDFTSSRKKLHVGHCLK